MSNLSNAIAHLRAVCKAERGSLMLPRALGGKITRTRMLRILNACDYVFAARDQEGTILPDSFVVMGGGRGGGGNGAPAEGFGGIGVRGGADSKTMAAQAGKSEPLDSPAFPLHVPPYSGGSFSVAGNTRYGITRREYLIAHAPPMPKGWYMPPDEKPPYPSGFERQQMTEAELDRIMEPRRVWEVQCRVKWAIAWADAVMRECNP